MQNKHKRTRALRIVRERVCVCVCLNCELSFGSYLQRKWSLSFELSFS